MGRGHDDLVLSIHVPKVEALMIGCRWITSISQKCMFDVACTSLDLLVRTTLEVTYHMEMESMKGKYQPCE